MTWNARARRRLLRIERDGFGDLPVCVAKTQYSFSTDPTLVGAPRATSSTSARSGSPPAPASSSWSAAT